jgi:CelD/BcsL family acetyltransferase involved in cellulose biosynthesis
MISSRPRLSGEYSATLRGAEDALEDGEIRVRWHELLRRLDPLCRAHASPQWLELRVRNNPESQKRVALLRDSDGEIVGLLPLETHAAYFGFEVSGRTLLQPHVNAAVVLGGEPMVPDDPDAHRSLYRAVLEQWREVDCISLSFPMRGSPWDLVRSKGRDRDYIAHLWGGKPQPRCVLGLDGDYDRYIDSTFTSKERYNLRRELRTLRSHGGGRLSLTCVEDLEDVEAFLSGATEVYRKTWQFRSLGTRPHSLNSTDLTAFAEAGILRSYLLTCGNEPCAYALGIQVEDIYFFTQTGYDESYAAQKLSPGKALISLMIEDLYRRNKPAYLDFGAGDSFYKQFFGGTSVPFADVLLMRDRLAHRTLCGAHQAFSSGVRLAKRVLRRG